ncbi:hypothetical protein D3261_03010 [Halococcus sp. IIIV-5B]|nr:hypothetical protein D3261_03010 [Halococcus sp. IIIV-5B]
MWSIGDGFGDDDAPCFFAYFFDLDLSRPIKEVRRFRIHLCVEQFRVCYVVIDVEHVPNFDVINVHGSFYLLQILKTEPSN